MASELEKIIGGKIIPNNKPGASTVLGTDAVVRAKKDGYTLLYGGASSIVYVPIANPDVVHYDPAKDLESLGLHFFLPQTITVRSDAPWKTFQEFIDYAKANPGKIRVSTTGIGSSPHFILEMIQSMTGARFTHVPFEGGESVVTAVLGGHVEATCEAVAKVKPHVEAGRMRILLITNKMAAFSNYSYNHGVGLQARPAAHLVGSLGSERHPGRGEKGPGSGYGEGGETDEVKD